nr:uncharacterized protein LOC125630947 [Caretta caretta]XP_048693115.1 uncharacterized protein LOC125630947 [Caretta caretta]
MQVWDDKQWLQNFWLCKVIFLELCMVLALALWHKDSKMRAALEEERDDRCVEAGNSDCYRSVTNLFGVGKSTTGAAFMQVSSAINHLLLRTIVTLRNVREIADGFAAMRFPNCSGAINGMHIPVLAQDHFLMEYINRKGYFSMIFQVLLNHWGNFTDINVGWFGKVHDGCIFRNTDLYRKLQTETFFLDQKIPVGAVEMPTVIQGNPAYPLIPWLMKPYTGNLDSSKKCFNSLSRCRMTIERAFGRLRACWHCFYGRLDPSKENIPMDIAACCALHNICEA